VHGPRSPSRAADALVEQSEHVGGEILDGAVAAQRQMRVRRAAKRW
jgi:hypothetical protein